MTVLNTTLITKLKSLLWFIDNNVFSLNTNEHVTHCFFSRIIRQCSTIMITCIFFLINSSPTYPCRLVTKSNCIWFLDFFAILYLHSGNLIALNHPDSFPLISQASKMYWLVNFKVLSATFLKNMEQQTWLRTMFRVLHCINTEISPNFLVWKFYGKPQFPQSFGRIPQNSVETVPFYKISTPGN